MAYDLVVRNGTVIDGKGGPRFCADVAVRNGRIAAIGQINDAANNTIGTVDATGKIVCPGFVDPHTHYDAQITWDQLLSSSSEHGVTTVMMGNCGVGIAPCRPPARTLLTEDLVTVEGIDHEVLTEGIRWDWETFPQFMDAAARRGTAINLAFMVPIAPLRTYVLGSEANDVFFDIAVEDRLQVKWWCSTKTRSRLLCGRRRLRICLPAARACTRRPRAYPRS